MKVVVATSVWLVLRRNTPVEAIPVVNQRIMVALQLTTLKRTLLSLLQPVHQIGHIAKV